MDPAAAPYVAVALAVFIVGSWLNDHWRRRRP